MGEVLVGVENGFYQVVQIAAMVTKEGEGVGKKFLLGVYMLTVGW